MRHFGDFDAAQARVDLAGVALKDAAVNLAQCDLASPVDGIVEKKYIETALKKSGGHMTNAAALLNMSFRSFRYKVKKYGLKK